jgi:fumarate hydratase subunit beta
MTVKKLTTPLTEEAVMDLKAGDNVLITGVIYSARDAAHKKLVDLLDQGEALPLDLQGQIIYYVGPAPAKPGQAIGSAGPTTSGRMDAYTPAILAQGAKGLVGKGSRSQAVKDALKKYKAVYFASVGGAAALTAKTIKKSDLVAYGELGAEAISRLEVEDFPVTVINDVYGNDLYEEGAKKYAR